MRVLFSKGIAAISKPRCGSTSLRRMLDPFLDPAAGDIAVNMAQEMPPFHPHISAPYLQEILQAQAPDARLEYLVTVRHPVRMLESYYKYFQPDENSRYNFDPKWSGSLGMTFEEWVLNGRLGMNPNWKRLAPAAVSESNLSALSLEACAMHQDGSLAVDHIFQIEEMDKLRNWLSEKLERDIEGKHVNQSESLETSALGDEALAKIRAIMPFESNLYGI